jgi:rare lipoprotein A (peptidoglycan hydrolase)
MRRCLAICLVLFAGVASPAAAATLGERTLGKGDHGSDVATLQRVLTMKGYSLGAADGVFGRMTKVAVKKFQRRAGLSVDGRVGPATLAGLARTWKVHRATYYGPGLYGNRTACGYTLSHRTRGVAHRSLPCGTRVAVYANGLMAVYPVIDHGPYTAGVSLDLTEAAARKVGVRTTSDVRAGW